jgi:hypothetical protein
MVVRKKVFRNEKEICVEFFILVPIYRGLTEDQTRYLVAPWEKAQFITAELQ